MGILIKINESDLYNIIKESVNNIISELDRNSKWQNKNNLMVTESNFKNDNRNNTHYAIHKPTGKIVFAWDYKGYDSEELKSDKKYYFLDDLKEIVGVNPKECTILTRNSCLKRGIDPKNNDTWCNQEELKNIYIEDTMRNKKKILSEGYYGKESVEIYLYDLDISNPNLEEFLNENDWFSEYPITIDMEFDEVPHEKETNYGGYAELLDYQIDLDENIKNNIPQEFLSDLMNDIEKYIKKHSDSWGAEAYENFNDEDFWVDDKYDEWHENNY